MKEGVRTGQSKTDWVVTSTRCQALAHLPKPPEDEGQALPAGNQPPLGSKSCSFRRLKWSLGCLLDPQRPRFSSLGITPTLHQPRGKTMTSQGPREATAILEYQLQ